jgi:reverse gyrase
MRGIYHGLCINCKGAISDELLLKFGICENCLGKLEMKSWKQVLQSLKDRRKLFLAEEIFAFHRKFDEFSKFFKKAVGQRMWSLQEVWAKRIILRQSFSIIAPTGVGKTVFGVVASLYFASKGLKSYIIVPTAILVQHISEKMDFYSKKLGIRPRKICYHTGLREEERKKALKKLENDDFEILITTERFLMNHFGILRKKNFDFVFVDDVDSFLKSPKNIDRILSVLGFEDNAIMLAFQLIDLRKEANRLKRMGKSCNEILAKIADIKKRIEGYKSQNKIGSLVVSGATVKAKRTKRIKLFEELLNFQVGFMPEFLRKIKDFYVEASSEMENQILFLIKNFGSGCLVFVPSAFGREYVLKLNDFLNRNGVKAGTYIRMDEKLLDKFEKGDYDALIGVASFRSPLARGIDFPEKIRYVIFAGVPRMEIKLSWEEYNPAKILLVLKNIREFLEKDQQEMASKIINWLRGIIPLDKQTIEKIRESIENEVQLSEYEEYVKGLIVRARNFMKMVITPKVVDEIAKSKEISIKKKGDDFYLIVADPIAYIQASGRASRMFAGGITHGASFLLVDDEKAFYSLKRKLEFIPAEVSFVRFSMKIAKKWFKKIDEDRAIIKEIREGKIIKRVKDFIKTALLIVESPTKARTISRFFGKPYRRKIGGITVFEVTTGEFLLNIIATMGHIFDLVVEEGFHGVKVENEEFVPIFDFIKKCSKCGEQFTGFDFCPKCKAREFRSKSEIVEAMRKLALEVNKIFIATDPDIEGEKIAYDVYCSLYSMNKKIERLEFHEITKRAFLQALKNRREINLKMVEAQLVRRIEDRWIGFELSKKLWQRFRNYKLSAGRVQTPVLGWIIERVNESRKKKRVLSAILSNGLKILIENPAIKFPREGLKKYIKKLKAKITDLKTEERSLNPLPPYTTDTLLRDASTKLGFSALKVMRLAQDLFETGLCTYHRTDSTTVSIAGINIAKEYIQNKYPSLFSPRRYLMKGAHECIRPTKALDAEQLKNLISLGILRFPKRLSNEHFQLYDMIFKRFIASQMREVKLLYQSFKVMIDGNQKIVENPVGIISEGFNLVLPIRIANPVKEGDYSLNFARILYLPKATPFTEGEIIALMKERGIGRPSTYAKIVSTILERQYALERKNRIVNTILGFKVYKYLSSEFEKYASEETTRKLEEIMDKIEQGKVNYKEVLKTLYQEIMEIEKI